MGRAVRADQAGPVDGEAHRQPLDRHVVHHLVEAALQERRVDRAERPQPRRREPGGESHRMLLGDADVEAPPREPLGERFTPVPSGMAAVIATIADRRLGLAVSALPKTEV